jgi:hypothetical protein
MPDKPNVVIINAVGNNFGLIGGIVEATRATNASNEAVTELASGHLDYKAYLTPQIERGLKATGFDTLIVPDPRANGESGKFLAKLPDAAGADALLDAYVSFVGYAAADASSAYRPTVHLEARLVDLKTQKVLFADQIYYNNFSQFAKKAISIEPAPTATFQNRDAMKLDPQDVADYLRAALDAVAAELVRQLQ